MWASLNAVVTAITDGWLAIFARWPPIAQLGALALPIALLALLSYRYTSNQAAIRSVKNRLKAYLLELRLFQDDFAVTLSAQWQILKHSVLYTSYALVPMAVIIVPVMLLLVQVESRYAWRALQPGDATILEVTLGSGRLAGTDAITLQLPAGLLAETPPLRLQSEGKILWRLRAQRPGDYEIVVRAGAAELRKSLVVGVDGAPSPAVYAADDIRALGAPLERALQPGTPVASLAVEYPRDRAEFAGLSTASWIVFAATLVLGYALRGLFGVTF